MNSSFAALHSPAARRWSKGVDDEPDLLLFPQSSASPVHWTLEELGIPYEKWWSTFAKGRNKTPEYLKINPNGVVPALVHDGVAIFESAAIQIYLGGPLASKGLYPPPGPARGEVMKWIVWTNVTLGDAMSRLGRNLGNWGPEDERNAKAGQTAKADLTRLLGIVEATLRDAAI